MLQKRIKKVSFLLSYVIQWDLPYFILYVYFYMYVFWYLQYTEKKKLQNLFTKGTVKNYRFGMPNRMATELTLQLGISPGEEQTRMLRRIMQKFIDGELAVESSTQQIVDMIREEGLENWRS